MPITATAGLVDALHDYRILEPAQLEEVKRTLQDRCADSRALARELLQRSWITAYQANQLLQGRGGELVLGPYLLLERLGEGGMGQVFKARHQMMNRTVALKIIRKELLANPDAVQRFHREIRLAAQLDHPHLVRAYDAAQVGETHFLVMEYAEGTDLYRLIQKSGPLPVVQACAYIAQAALGLQHASDRGMVHRDIKPSNLQVTDKGTVIKILDMGMARTLATDGGGGGGTELTQARSVLGTPDYIAPEQIADPRRVDVRADIYSLGCTFYFLLSGRPPFPDGDWDEKLACHRKVEPQPIEQLRGDVPPAVGAILRKMMAKRPEDRYASASAVADALQLFCQQPQASAVPQFTWSLAPPAASTISAVKAADSIAVIPATLIERPATAAGAGATLTSEATPCLPPSAIPTQIRSMRPPGPTLLVNSQTTAPTPAQPPARGHAGFGMRFWVLLVAGNVLGGVILLVVVLIMLWPKGEPPPKGDTKKSDDLLAKVDAKKSDVPPAKVPEKSDDPKGPPNELKPVLPALLIDEDFHTVKIGNLPKGWKTNTDGDKKGPYQVGEDESETKYLELYATIFYKENKDKTVEDKQGDKKTKVTLPPVLLNGDFYIEAECMLAPKVGKGATVGWRMLTIRLERSDGRTPLIVAYSFAKDQAFLTIGTERSFFSMMPADATKIKRYGIVRQKNELLVLYDQKQVARQNS